MIRNYENDSENESVSFFVGTEIENTPMKGRKTLFVVGLHDADKIDNLAVKNSVDHIYLGANMSFNVTDNEFEQWYPWEQMATGLLEKNYWVTLDIDYSQVEGLLESGLTEYNRFIPMISVKIPYIEQLGYNACLKLDDKDFDATNFGVWVHSVHDLMDRTKFTDWSQYRLDKIIKDE